MKTNMNFDTDEIETSPSLTKAELFKAAKNKQSVLNRLKIGTEGTLVLVGSLANIDKPICALVRLAEGIVMPNALEVPIPMRLSLIHI